jgi:transposase
MSDHIAVESFWTGFRLFSQDTLSDAELVFRLEPDPAVAPRCGRCGHACGLVHDVSRRRVRERDLFDRRVWLDVPLRRVECLQCGRATERLAWLAPHSRLTTRMVAWVEVLAALLPIRHVEQLTGLHWHTIKGIDRRRLERTLQPPDLSELRHLIMDEFALHKGHRYATVAMCADTQQVLWIGEGRSREAIRPLFEWLGQPVCNRIRAVAMDMNSAMDLEVQAHCPNARVIYDLFHVVAKFGREVVDRVRVDQANQLRDQPAARRVIKRSRWLLLRNEQNLNEQQAVTLDEVLAANAPLMSVYVLKNQLKELWYAPSPWAARKRWNEWFRMAMDTGLAPVQAFARRLRPYIKGIIASARFRLHTSVLEGMNNRIKVIKRTAYGYRDTAYFFLKIKAAFPGKAR